MPESQIQPRQKAINKLTDIQRRVLDAALDALELEIDTIIYKDGTDFEMWVPLLDEMCCRTYAFPLRMPRYDLARAIGTTNYFIDSSWKRHLGNLQEFADYRAFCDAIKAKFADMIGMEFENAVQQHS